MIASVTPRAKVDWAGSDRWMVDVVGISLGVIPTYLMLLVMLDILGILMTVVGIPMPLPPIMLHGG